MSHADFLCKPQKMKHSYKTHIFVPEAKPNDDLDFIQFLLGQKRFDMYINDTKNQIKIAEMILFFKSV